MIRTRHPIAFKAVDLFRAFNLDTSLLPLGDIDHPGVYTMLYKGIPMYVGKSSGSLLGRFRLHFTMTQSIAHITDEIWCNKGFITCLTRRVPKEVTHELEIQQIQRLKPFLNKAHNPDPRPIPHDFILPGENRRTGLLLIKNGYPSPHPLLNRSKCGEWPALADMARQILEEEKREIRSAIKNLWDGE